MQGFQWEKHDYLGDKTKTVVKQEVDLPNDRIAQLYPYVIYKKYINGLY